MEVGLARWRWTLPGGPILAAKYLFRARQTVRNVAWHWMSTSRRKLEYKWMRAVRVVYVNHDRQEGLSPEAQARVQLARV